MGQTTSQVVPQSPGLSTSPDAGPRGRTGSNAQTAPHSQPTAEQPEGIASSPPSVSKPKPDHQKFSAPHARSSYYSHKRRRTSSPAEAEAEIGTVHRAQDRATISKSRPGDSKRLTDWLVTKGVARTNLKPYTMSLAHVEIGTAPSQTPDSTKNTTPKKRKFVDHYTPYEKVKPQTDWERPKPAQSSFMAQATTNSSPQQHLPTLEILSHGNKARASHSGNPTVWPEDSSKAKRSKKRKRRRQEARHEVKSAFDSQNEAADKEGDVRPSDASYSESEFRPWSSSSATKNPYANNSDAIAHDEGWMSEEIEGLEDSPSKPSPKSVHAQNSVLITSVYHARKSPARAHLKYGSGSSKDPSHGDTLLRSASPEFGASDGSANARNDAAGHRRNLSTIDTELEALLHIPQAAADPRLPSPRASQLASEQQELAASDGVAGSVHSAEQEQDVSEYEDDAIDETPHQASNSSPPTSEPEEQTGHAPFDEAQVDRLDIAIDSHARKWKMGREEVVALLHRPISGRNSELWRRLFHAVPEHIQEDVVRFCQQKWPPPWRRATTWTSEDDKLLKKAYARHPGKWVKIAPLVGKSKVQCRNRWRNHGRYGGARRAAPWEEEELRRLLDIVRGLTQVIAQAKRDFEGSHKDDRDVEGKAFEPLDYIDWNVVSERMGHTRTRQQCAQKIQRMRWALDAATPLQSTGQTPSQAAACRCSVQKPNQVRSKTEVTTTGKHVAERKRRSEAAEDPPPRSSNIASGSEHEEPATDQPETAPYMVHGDYYALLRHIIACAPAMEHDVPWKRIQRQMAGGEDGDGFSVEDRQRALLGLMAQVGKRETFGDTLWAAKTWLEEVCGDTLAVRYMAAKRLEEQGLGVEEIVERLQEGFERF